MYLKTFYRLSKDEKKCLGDIDLSHLHATVMYFVVAIKDGYYDFHTLPVSIKKPLNPSDCDILDNLKHRVKYKGM